MCLDPQEGLQEGQWDNHGTPIWPYIGFEVHLNMVRLILTEPRMLFVIAPYCPLDPGTELSFSTKKTASSAMRYNQKGC